MSARRLILDEGPGRAAVLAEWAAVLRGGGIAAFPTDTVWGIGALARDATAIERIHALKGRGADQPMACLVRDAAMARGLALEWAAPVEALAQRHWPGPLTLVVRTGERFPAAQRGRPTLGLRVPDRRAVLELLDLLGEPLAATSANRSGQPELPDAAAVMAELGGLVDLVVDDGRAVGGIASTVLEWGGFGWRVLRRGDIALDENLR